MLRRLVEERASFGLSASTPVDREAPPRGGGVREKSLSNEKITVEDAITVSGVIAIITLISQDTASLPLILYGRTKQGRYRAVDNPYYTLLHDTPNPEMSSLVFRELIGGHLIAWGNFYAQLIWDGSGSVKELWPLRPDRMMVQRVKGEKVYKYITSDGKQRTFLRDEIVHIPAFGFDGLVGYSRIALARNAIGLAKATEKYGSKFFANDARPGIVLEHPKTLSPKAQANLKLSFVEEHQGADLSHGVFVAEEGMKVVEIGIPPEDAQFLECVVPGTLFTMADGTRRAAELLKPDDEVMGWNNGPIRARVMAVGRPPQKPLIRVMTARGRVLTASADHPFLAIPNVRTPGGRQAKLSETWIAAGKLQIGNYVRIGLGNVGVSGDMAFDIAWFLGAMVGDGYIRNGGCSFSGTDSGVINEMRKLVESLGGGLKKRHSRPSDCDFELLTGGKGCKGSPIRTLLTESGLVGSHSATKRVPESVMSGGEQAWRGFLSGYLDTDGSVRLAKPGVQPCLYWSSVNRDLLDDCQHLLALLGVQSAIYSISPGGRKEIMGQECDYLPSWGLYITGSVHLSHAAEMLLPKHTDKAKRLRTFLDLPESRYRTEIFNYDAIISVEEMGVGETIGIEIEGIHTHITAGLVTHNTRKFQLMEINRILGPLPPHMLGDVERSTSWGSGIDSQEQGYVNHTLRAYTVRIEQALGQQLLLPADRQRGFYFEHLFDGLLRGDIATRYEAYTKAITVACFMNRNEARVRENLNPAPGLDEFLVPQNMAKVGADAPANQSAFDPLWNDVLARVVKREANDVRGAARRYLAKGQGAEFATWLDQFYGQDQPAFIRRQIEPLLASMRNLLAVDGGAGLQTCFEAYLAAQRAGLEGLATAEEVEKQAEVWTVENPIRLAERVRTILMDEYLSHAGGQDA